jgi:alpha-glucoside transport system substrate-binding protein
MMPFKCCVPIILGISLLSLTACGDSSESGGAGERTVTILGVVVGEQQDRLEEALVPFEEKTGINVEYEGTDAFGTLLPVRVEAGDAPDVAMFPQPGLMQDFAKSGKLIPVTNFMQPSALEAAYPEEWLKLATVEGKPYGVWYRASVKSLVWYNPQAFKAKGYEIPQNWTELIALSDKIVANGEVPWCLGMESGDATGWVGTDWVEDIMLRTAGPEVYDQWIQHQIPFDAPPVKEAFETFGEVVRKPKYIAGGAVGIISTPFGDSPKGLFYDPPRCYLHRQANFVSSFFAEDIVPGENVDVFPFPEIDAKQGLPILVGGDVFGMFNDTPEAQALMQYLATPEPHEIWAKSGGFISPHKAVPLEVYPDVVAKKQAEILANADEIRFDGSDLMPGAVGTGSFWSGVVDYVNGTQVDAVVSNIESSWPK